MLVPATFTSPLFPGAAPANPAVTASSATRLLVNSAIPMILLRMCTPSVCWH